MSDASIHAARVLMGDSLGFHIIFVLFGLTLPILVSWFEWMGIRHKDGRLIETARFWSKIMAILVITGVISGTIIALQMSLVWPGILKFGGDVIGLPFLFETYAFLIEATFLALYMATWKNARVSQKLHGYIGFFVIFGSTLSAFAITSINAWMNLPAGFDFVGGKIQNIDVWKAIFSRTSIVEFIHSMPGYYLAGTLMIAGLYAFTVLRSHAKNRESFDHERRVMGKLLGFVVCCFVLSGITADISGKYLAKYEPEKLAAIELVYDTTTNAPLTVGGVPGDNNTIVGPHLQIPDALSILAGNSVDTTVQGLNDFSADTRPPLYVHTIFDVKMTLITILGLLAVLYIGLHFLKPDYLKSRAALWILGVVSVFGICIVELGWMMTEIGRQPWAVRDYVTTAQALTTTHDITSFGYFFPLAYLVLFIVTILAVRKVIHSNKTSQGGEL